jgi:hypothetical protein
VRYAKACSVSFINMGEPIETRGKKRGKMDARSREADSGDLCRQLGMNMEPDKGNKGCEQNKKITI